MIVSIHASRGGSDACFAFSTVLVMMFQSTLPVGGATQGQREFHGCKACFNPRFPWGERQQQGHRKHNRRQVSIHASRGGSDTPVIHPQVLSSLVSIHASRGGSDHITATLINIHIMFQSTLPVGGATEPPNALPRNTGVSIHASRGGSDHSYLSVYKIAE